MHSGRPTLERGKAAPNARSLEEEKADWSIRQTIANSIITSLLKGLIKLG